MRYSREESEFDRAIGFLDATLALALTLLVLSPLMGRRRAREAEAG